MKTHWKRVAARGLAGLALLCGTCASVQAACPYPFRLSGKIDQPWKQVTNSAWNKMLPPQWTDNGFHFYSRVRDRGPADGINTPSDLESEILKKVSEGPEGTPNRWQILLPLVNSKGANLRVIYDYDGGKTSKCQLVTLSY